jgi:hypothetical protein
MLLGDKEFDNQAQYTGALFFPEKKRIEPEIIRSLPNKMRTAPAQFQHTGDFRPF